MIADPEPLSLGIDLGATKILAAVVTRSGTVVDSIRIPTNAEAGPRSVIDSIARAAGGLLNQSKIDCAGIGVAGQVDRLKGEVRYSANLGWEHVPLRDELANQLRLSVTVINDVQAATWGELQYGAGRGARELVALFVGTGIGGGIVTEGRLLTGANYAAGELGHITVVANGRKCRCPNYGCLEAYAGGWAIAERAIETIHRDPGVAAGLLARAGSVEQVTAETVCESFRAGDPLAVRLINETAGIIAAALAGVVNALNPAVIILGGGVIDGAPEMIPSIENDVRRLALPLALEGLCIRQAALGANAIAIGAAAFARSITEELNMK